MKNYIEHIKNTRTTHERRVHALQVASVVTAAVFVVWLGTLGLRLGTQGTVAQDSGSQTQNTNQTSLAASAAAQVKLGAHLEVSTTSVYSQ